MIRRMVPLSTSALSALLITPLLAQSPPSTPSQPPALPNQAPGARPAMPSAPPPSAPSTRSSTGMPGTSSSTENSPATPKLQLAANASPTSGFLTTDRQVRTSKLIGSTVYNDAKEKIGTVDDVLIDDSRGVTGAVLSVGGFLGIGSKLVKISIDQIRIDGDTVSMSGATKEQLNTMPEFRYVS